MARKFREVIWVAWAGRDITIWGNRSTKGGRSFLTIEHTCPAGYVDENAPGVFQALIPQPAGLPNISPVHCLAHCLAHLLIALPIPLF
ncbi:hypothetical protein R1flu_000092 [Riccia fluitans]|uniref:Uncharacterized protein n=1 Tax=Riccia fluitans TaxID=41844 RepID=A0ABD1XZH0_9MARC